MRYRIRLGKILYPEKLRVSQFPSLRQDLIEPEENRDLNRHRQTTAYGIDTVLLVKLHHLLVHSCGIIFVFLTQLLHFRSKQRSLAHRLIGLGLEWPEHQTHDERQDENGNTITLHKTVNGVQEIEQKLTDNFEHAKIHDLGLVL